MAGGGSHLVLAVISIAASGCLLEQMVTACLPLRVLQAQARQAQSNRIRRGNRQSGSGADAQHGQGASSGGGAAGPSGTDSPRPSNSTSMPGHVLCTGGMCGGLGWAWHRCGTAGHCPLSCSQTTSTTALRGSVYSRRGTWPPASSSASEPLRPCISDHDSCCCCCCCCLRGRVLWAHCAPGPRWALRAAVGR
jgi:hypothetical protein